MLSQHSQNSTMAGQGAGRDCILAVDHVTVDVSYGEKLVNCKVLLKQNQIECVVCGVSKLTVPLSQMNSIQIHQPIFGANYISGEYAVQGETKSFTMTFTKGGATDFARAFFRITEGRLVAGEQESEQSPPVVPTTQSHTSDVEDKKHR